MSTRDRQSPGPRRLARGQQNKLGFDDDFPAGLSVDPVHGGNPRTSLGSVASGISARRESLLKSSSRRMAL